MTPDQASTVLDRLSATWPRNNRSAETDKEWLRFLRPLGYELSGQAVDALRDTLGFPPTIADFRSAYRMCEASPSSYAAVSGKVEDPTYFDLYGSEMNDWVYCFKCDMAITLEERATEPYYAPGHGLHHKSCPRRGTSPIMPTYLRLEREDAMRKKGAR